MLQIRHLGWAWLLVVAFSWPGACLAVTGSAPSPEGGILTRVVSVKSKTTDRETVLTVEGNGRIQEYSWETFEDPPRIVVDLLCTNPGFESRTLAVSSPNIERVRIGHHPDRIRLVFDVKGLPLPAFSVAQKKTSLVLTVASDRRVAPGMVQAPSVPEPEKADDRKEEVRADEKRAVFFAPEEAVPPHEDRTAKTSPGSSSEELPDLKNPDTHPDTVLLRQGIEAFGAKRWASAIERFRLLLEQDPGSPHGERASFLLARSYDGAKDPSVPSQILEVQGYYDAFLGRYGSSQFAAEALVAKGHLSVLLGHHEEAIGYYGLAFNRHKDSPAAAGALAGKMRVLILKRQWEDALAVSQYLLRHYPQSPEALDAKMELAKLLYEMNRFKESLAALTGLDTREGRTVYLRPEIALYVGYNAYELGNHPQAREHLMRYYNMVPASKESSLVLAKIGDTYREQNLLDPAAKVYQWAIERHPDSEGALICRIRLAELQGQGQGKAHQEGPGWSVEKALSQREAYESILKSSSRKEDKNPLVALAYLKLAVIYQKQEEYGKSLAMIKELLNRFGTQPLQKETDHILLKSLEGTVRQALQANDHAKAVHFYYEEKDLFLRINSPELFLAIARAFLNLDLKEDALDLFKTAGGLLPDEEKPADLLYYQAWDLQRRNQPEQALEPLRAITDRGKDKAYISRAHQLRGRILAGQKQWDRALEAFASALKSPPDGCTHLEILTERASAMASCGMKEAALQSIRQARDLAKGCAQPPLPVLEDLADVLFRLGRTGEALVLIEEEMGKEENRQEEARLQWRLAQYRESLGQAESSQTVYRRLSQIEDPLWASLAKERMEDLRFQRDMGSFTRP
ncbi:MAG: tetratricopeptide repeat protein [Desulfobacterota bacterium]|nr:tetratricopeptide repeat protein [Thermodesulfobacteriota bacterium]